MAPPFSKLPPEIFIQICERVVEFAVIDPTVLDGIAFADRRSYIGSREILLRTRIAWLEETRNATVVEDILHSARHPERARTLAELALRISDVRGRTPISYAAEKGHFAVVELLLSHAQSLVLRKLTLNAQHNQRCTRSSSAARMVETFKYKPQRVAQPHLAQAADLAYLDCSGRSSLSYAAENGHVEVIQLLLDSGADPESHEERSNRTPLSYAVEKGHDNISHLLLVKGASAISCGNNGWQPIHFAAERGRLDGARMLLKAGASCSARTTYWDAPVHIAASNGHHKIVQLFLKKGANCNSKDAFEDTPLHLAAENGHATTVQLLLEAGAFRNTRDHINQTPLHLAAENGHATTVQLLLEDSAWYDSRDGADQTPLHLAAKNGHDKTIQLLLGKGAKRNNTDLFLNTPLDLVRYNDEKTKQLLSEHGEIAETAPNVDFDIRGSRRSKRMGDNQQIRRKRPRL